MHSKKDRCINEKNEENSGGNVQENDNEAPKQEDKDASKTEKEGGAADNASIEPEKDND